MPLALKDNHSQVFSAVTSSSGCRLVVSQTYYIVVFNSELHLPVIHAVTTFD